MDALPDPLSPLSVQPEDVPSQVLPQATGATRYAARSRPEKPLPPELHARLLEAALRPLPPDYKPSTFASARAKLAEIQRRRAAAGDDGSHVPTDSLAPSPPVT